MQELFRCRRVFEAFNLSTAELQLEVEPDVVEVASQFSLAEAEDLEATDTGVRFALTRHLHVLTTRLRLSCCVGMECWVVSTRGLAAYGQAEIVIVLQCLPDELLPPLDLFRYLYSLYSAVKKGACVCYRPCAPLYMYTGYATLCRCVGFVCWDRKAPVK